MNKPKQKHIKMKRRIESAEAQPTRQTEEVCRQGAANASLTPPADGGLRKTRGRWKRRKKEKRERQQGRKPG